VIDRLAACCDNGDDRQMLAIIEDLATHGDRRQEAGAVLLRALELRPNWGPLLDPKAWRAEVRNCLWQLYDMDALRQRLASRDDRLSPHLDRAVGSLFDSPLAIIEPVLDSKVGFEQFLPAACSLLETLLAACARHGSEPEDIEGRLQSIQSLDAGIDLLDTCFKPAENYNDLRRAASRVRDLLDNPEVAVWQD
jgi:hypothetical protein